MPGREDVAGLLSGRFRLGELLGTGGSASVFAAVDTRSGSDIALKILHPHLSERPAARDAFIAAARRVMPLRHPNIVAVLDVGFDETEAGPLTWIALERAAGCSLTEHVARDGALSPADAVSVIEGVLRGLEAAHAMGVIHRDVSPANVMVAPGPDGTIEIAGVRLLDFGLADAAGTTTVGTDELLSVKVTGRAGVIGNVNYMSPEQARGAPVDARGDVYQAGAVLHFALTGRPPFPRESAEQTVRAHLYTPPPVPSVTDGRIPRGLDRIVVRAMLKDPADRFASAAAMRAAVGALAITPAVVDPTITTVIGAGGSRGTGLRDASTVRAAGASRRAPTAVDDVTRVLGRTAVPRRASPPALDVPLGAPPAGGPPVGGPLPREVRAGSRAGAWFVATVGGAVVAAVIIASAANSSPTALVETQPSSSPSSTEVLQSASTPEATAPARTEVPLLSVPDLVRLTVREAEAALADAGLVLGAVAVADSPFPRETVLASSPASGDRLRAGSTVTLTVASGYNAIPDVAGQGRDAAASLVHAAGFAPSFAYRAGPVGTPAGAILGSDPGPGTSVAVGTAITVFEALPASSTPSPSPTATAAPTPSRPTATPTATPGPGRP